MLNHFFLSRLHTEAKNSYQKQQEQVNTNLQPFYNPAASYLAGEISEQLERSIRNLHALNIFCVKKKFAESLQLFQSMRTDPSHLVALLPGLLPDNYRNQLHLDEHYPQLNPIEQKEAIDALIDYLQAKRAEFLKQNDSNTADSQLNARISADSKNTAFQLIPLIEGRIVIKTKRTALQIIDTTLLKCYLKSKENLVQFFLRRDANFLHLEESEKLLIQHNKLVELVILYEKKEAHEKALSLLLVESVKSNSNLGGYKHMVEYLKKIGNKNLPLIFKYAKAVLQAEPHFGMRVFLSGNVHKLDRILVKKSIEKEDSSYKQQQQRDRSRSVASSEVIRRKATNDDYDAYAAAAKPTARKNSILNILFDMDKENSSSSSKDAKKGKLCNNSKL
jgi:hypothetical protein